MKSKQWAEIFVGNLYDPPKIKCLSKCSIDSVNKAEQTTGDLGYQYTFHFACVSLM